MTHKEKIDFIDTKLFFLRSSTKYCKQKLLDKDLDKEEFNKLKLKIQKNNDAEKPYLLTRKLLELQVKEKELKEEIKGSVDGARILNDNADAKNYELDDVEDKIIDLECKVNELYEFEEEQS